MLDNLKLMICGSRTITNKNWVFEQISDYISELPSSKEITIIQGDARGVDTLAKSYALKHDLSLKNYPAEWDKYGKSAGYIRNEIMVKECDYCLILWDGESKGTKHDIDLCEKFKKPNKVVKYEI